MSGKLEPVGGIKKDTAIDSDEFKKIETLNYDDKTNKSLISPN